MNLYTDFGIEPKQIEAFKNCDIKRFLLLLIENDIPIPEDLISKYINKALVKPVIKLPF